jgi:type I restriction enzyme S subunit
MESRPPYHPLGDLCDNDRGITYGIVKVGEFVVGGVRVIRGGDIREGRIVFDDDKRVSEDISCQFRRTILRGGEVVINLIAEPGHSAIVPDELAGANVSRDVAVIPLSPLVDHRYVSYFLRSPQAIRWLTSRMQGSVTQKINLSTLRELPVPVPSISDQRRVADLLSCFDDKIDLSRRMNETLETMAKAIFKDWFVDFGPTCAKMEGRPPYLSQDVWSLFPNRLDDEGKPQGWGWKPLDQIAQFLNGLALQKFRPSGSTYLPVIKIAELRAGGVGDGDRASDKVPSEYVVEDGDLLFSWSGSLLQRIWAGGRGALNQHLFKVTSSSVPKWFYYYWISQNMERFRAIAASKATTMGHIQRHHLSEAITVVPTTCVMSAANEVMEPLFNRSLANDIECRTLVAVHDLLLPKLMSGEIRIKDAEKVVETVL